MLDAVPSDAQAAELAAVRRMLAVSQGCFSLSLAVCNSPALRDWIIEQLKRESPNLCVVAVPKGTVDVYDYVNRSTRATPCA